MAVRWYLPVQLPNSQISRYGQVPPWGAVLGCIPPWAPTCSLRSLIAAGGESTRVMRAATLSCARPSAIDDTCSEVELRAVPIRRRLRDNGIICVGGLGRAGGRRGSSIRMAAPAPHWHCRPISCCASAGPPARAMRSAQRAGVHVCFVAAMMRRVPRWGMPNRGGGADGRERCE